MKVRDIMSECSSFCTPDSTLQEAAQLMHRSNLGEIPVIDSMIHKHPLGLISEHDIACRVVAEGYNPLEMTVGEFMTAPCATVTPNMSIQECGEILEKNNLRRVPVIDAAGECCGIVDREDLPRWPQTKSSRKNRQYLISYN